MKGWLGACVAASVAFVTATAAAESEPIRIEYHADASCPTAAQFVAQVLARTLRAHLANPGEVARTFEISIERGNSEFKGSLVIHETDGQTRARRVSDFRCLDVADVLVLSTVLAIDPAAMTPRTRAEQDTTPKGTPNGAPQLGNGTVEGKPEGKPATESGAKQDQSSSESPPSAARHAAPEPHAWDYTLSLGPVLRTGSTPRALLGGRLGFTAHPPSRVVSALSLELLALESLDYSLAGAKATFEFVLAHPRVCSFAWRPLGPLSLAPCVGLDLGQVTGRGSVLPAPSTAARFWMAAELPLELELALGERALLSLDAGLLLPLTRYQFVFSAPETSIYVTPPVAFTIELGFGVRL